MSDTESADICLACHVVIRNDSTAITCSECAFAYHAGNCAGVGEAALKAKPDIGKSWLCPTCKASKLRGSQNSGKAKQDTDADILARLANMNKKIGALLPLLNKIEELMTMKQTVQAIEENVKFLSDKYDNVIELVSAQQKEITELRERVETVESGASLQEIKELKKDINDLDQYSRRQNLEIHGMEHTEGENLLTKVNGIARKLEIPEITPRDVEAIHRLPCKPNKVPAVLVRFSSRTLKDQWNDKRSLLMTKVPGIRLFDNMSPQNKKLFWLAKTRATEKSYEFSWQRNGRIYVRKRAGELAIQIKTEDDLIKIT